MGRDQRIWVARCKREGCGYIFYPIPTMNSSRASSCNVPKCEELRRYHKGEIFLLRVREKIMTALLCRIPR
jgi:hypothetical protein